MRRQNIAVAFALAGVVVVLMPGAVRADRWDVSREIAEGNREIRQERREAVREIARADSPWEVRHEIREAQREIRHEQREQRREVRREVNHAYRGW